MTQLALKSGSTRQFKLQLTELEIACDAIDDAVTRVEKTYA